MNVDEEDEKYPEHTNEPLLNSKFEIKIGDFGFARKLENDETMNEFFGTLAYMAPEILTK